MPDKKVGRFGRRPITPTQKMEAALSDAGTVDVADISHAKGKSTVADKFREREEKWRREKTLHDQQEGFAAEQAGRHGDEPDESVEQQGEAGDGEA
jgi:hypothetical protein